MSNDYYNADTVPPYRGPLLSDEIRAMKSALEGAFDKLPDGNTSPGFTGGLFSSPTISGGSLSTTTVGSVTEPVASVVGTYLLSTLFASAPSGITMTDCAGIMYSSVSGTDTAYLVANGGYGGAFDETGNFIAGKFGTDVATTATAGFFYVPSCAGTPTGVPAVLPTGALPMVYDRTNNKLCVYDGGWIQTAALT